MTPDGLITILEDILHLENSITINSSDPDIRHSSAIVRRFLIEGALVKAASLYDRKIRIIVSEHCFPENNPIGLEADIFWWPPTDSSSAFPLNSFQMFSRRLSGDEMKALSDIATDHKRKKVISIDRFLSLPSFTFKGKAISRRSLIKYVANKLGGVHLDSSRKEPAAELHSDEDLYPLLESYDSTMRLMDRRLVYIEMLQIISSVIKSRDIQKLRAQLMETRHIFPDIIAAKLARNRKNQ